MIELVPETYFVPLDLLAIFGRIAPLHVDLGCADGAFLVELAKSHPEKTFLGTEKLVGRVAKACRKAGALENIRILNVESSYAVRYLLPEASVETFYLLFPDPWPKRRHRRRRVVHPDFIESIERALKADGLLHIATDQLDYYRDIEKTAAATGKLECIMHSCLPRPLQLPETKFERRFREQGAPIYRLTLRKVSPVR